MNPQSAAELSLPPFVPGTPISLMLFLAVVIAVIGMILYGAILSGRKSRAPRSFLVKIVIFLSLWIRALSLVVASGILREKFIPAVPMLVFVINLGAILFGMSSWGKQFSKLPLWYLVAFQGFRFPLEIVLHL